MKKNAVPGSIDYIKDQVNSFKGTLNKLIDECNQVFITGHSDPDYDALASMGAMSLVCKRNKKVSYIVMSNEDLEKIKENHYDRQEMINILEGKFIILTTEQYEQGYKGENNLLIVVDANKEKLTPFDGMYNDFRRICIIDHHGEDKGTIKTNNKLIIEKTSSCSEILTFMLRSYGIASSDVNYYMLLKAGIRLDTDKLDKNVYRSTYDCLSFLESKLTELEEKKIEEWFTEDFHIERHWQNIVDCAEFVPIDYLIAIADNGEYTKEETAKAADYCLRYKCDAVICLAKSKDGGFHVCLRTKNEKINVDNLAHYLNGGGGNLSSASSKNIYVDEAVDNKSPKEILKDKVEKILRFKFKRES